jgi:hypothetical protein
MLDRALIGFSIVTEDIEIGDASSLLLHDQSRTIRDATLGVRHCFTWRQVLISVTALHQPWVKGPFLRHLTQDQALQYLHISSKQPVSRQQKIAMKQYCALHSHLSTKIRSVCGK